MQAPEEAHAPRRASAGLAGLLAAFGGALLLGASSAAWVLLAAACAYATAAGRRGWLLAVASAGCGAMAIRLGDLSAAASGAGWVITGMAVGAGIRWRWSIRTVVALAAAGIFVLTAWPALNWERWLAQHEAYIESVEAQIALQAQAGDERDAQALRAIGWLKENWPRYGVGLYAGIALFGAALGAALLNRWLGRRLGLDGLEGSFGQLRTPDWLVWAAIAVAGAHFAGRAWPDDTLDLVKWNAAAALLAAYMLNGLSIVVYGARTAGVHWAVAALMALMILYGSPSLGVIGFVDTWAEFRRKLDRIAAARARGAADKDGAS